MEHYIQTGTTGRSTNHLRQITTNRLPSLCDCKIDTTWVDYCLHTMDSLAIDFNFYMFFKNTFPNIPQRLYFVFLNTSILDLVKLLDSRKDNKISLPKILNRIEQSIDSSSNKTFLLFKRDIDKWLEKQNPFVDNIIILRDKMIAHQDVSLTQLDILQTAMDTFDINRFIYVSNATIEIISNIIEAIFNCTIPTSGYYNFDEFNFIYESLRSLDKIEKNIFQKNLIIHNIDLELQEIKRLIK